MKYRELLDEGIKKAIELNKDDSAVRLLLMDAANMESSDIILKFEEEVNEEVVSLFNNNLDKYLQDNIPVQHIIGYEYFYGHKFIVNSDVLIPRFETEELVANILMEYDELFDDREISLVDIGTGSGCLALTLAKEEPSIKVTATDISNEALVVAKENAKNLEVDVDFLCGDMLKPLENKKFDILVSNPPYIPQDEEVDSLVKDNEPHLALFGGEDGLKFYRIILENARDILNDKFIIAFEHAYDKGEEMKELAKKYFSDCEIKILKDMQNKDRMTFVIKR